MHQKPLLLLAALLFASSSLLAQQIDLSRVSLMPDMPSAYHLRDWKQVAKRYDSLVFDITKTGEHLPIVSVGAEGVNYPEIAPIFMDSYVGSSSHGQQREAINIIPAIVGASLVGIDKTSQFGVDWVSKVKDFYNFKNEELVYLNGPSDRSGHDWWYETMPNIFFYQLHDLYPTITDFDDQFVIVADRWLAAVKAMGASDAPWTEPYMNYRAWNLKEMTPLETGVKEPEAAGAIAWILYQAYQHTLDEKYLIGAQWSLDFLDAQTTNPSYELQLPYGVLAAAKLNAVHGADYDIEKLLNWCFDRGDLRGWGSVVGTWGGEDVSGLIGEANDQGNDYVFIMNGFQHAAALAPLVKYDKRFAKAIGKWILNMTNASRLFYSSFLPENQQSDYAWCQANDPYAVIAYEAIKEQWDGTSLYARGDSKSAGWADTNLGLYGSSHVGYLGAIVDPTDVEGILQIDVNVTDFYASNDFPTYLYFNPHNEEHSFTIQVGESSKNLYDAISEEEIKTNVLGVQTITIPANGVLLISLIPAEAEMHNENGKLYADNIVVDHHYGYDFSPQLRIKSLASPSEQIELNRASNIYCTIDGTGEATFQWFVDGALDATSNSAVFEYTPTTLGDVTIRVVATTGGQSVCDSIVLEIVELIPEPPVIESIHTESKWYRPNTTFDVLVSVTDPKGLDLTYDWSVENGSITETDGPTVQVKSESPGVVLVNIKASNGTEESTASHKVLVVNEQPIAAPLLQLSMNNTSADQSGNNFSTQLSGGTFVDGPTGEALEALRFSSASHELLVSNANELNFRDQIAISLWVSFTNFTEERFLISHGSWEKRWKLSTTEDKKLRWTVNATSGIKDLDSSEDMEVGHWYHVLTVFDGSSMQLFLDGELDAFVDHSGQINISDVGISVGKRLAGDPQYDLKGTLDEVRIFDQSIDPESVPDLMSQWSVETITGTKLMPVSVYPNPFHDFLQIKAINNSTEILITDISGRMIKKVNSEAESLYLGNLTPGVYFIRVKEQVFRVVKD
ncbi:MAG: LamG-like jellyroll fold domain-containing protein [Cyclobacteriaceae bacterium]